MKNEKYTLYSAVGNKALDFDCYLYGDDAEVIKAVVKRMMLLQPYMSKMNIQARFYCLRPDSTLLLDFKF